MRRGIIVLLLALAGAVTAYYCCFLLGTAEPRALLRSEHPELSWLKDDFRLADAEFQRISALHAGYLPQCKERCSQIDQLNHQLSVLLTEVREVTPQVSTLLAERSRIWAVCQTEMLKHFFEVSRSMPSEQGERYLRWVSTHTHLRQESMSHGQDETTPSPPSTRPR